MAHPHAGSGEVVSLRPLGEGVRDARTTALIKAGQLEVVRIVLPAGKGLREHAAPGEITAQGLEGKVEFRTAEAVHVLTAGDLLHLRAGEPHSLIAMEDASMLVTKRLASS